MDFRFQGQVICESTRTRSKTLAKRIQERRKRELEEGIAGIRRRPQTSLFSAAAGAYVDLKRGTLAASSLAIEQANLKHLLPIFGKRLLTDLEARDISQYQAGRLDRGASPSTINLEVATLRAILKRQGLWARLQPDVKMLSGGGDVGKALTAEEEAALLRACRESRSRSLCTFVVLALDTGARFNTIRTLVWGNVDLERRCLRFGKDKTAAGTGRLVPLNVRATETLTQWASQFPNRKPEHYVFPRERYGGKGSPNDFGFGKSVVYDSDPTKPIGDPKMAWEKAKQRAGIYLNIVDEESGGFLPLVCRFHDLRHTAVSRMLHANVPLAKIAKIVGWSPSTMVQMSARYGHFSLEELRGAVASISNSGPRVESV